MACYENGCCCWGLKKGAMAAAIFTTTTSAVQLFTQGAVWGGHPAALNFIFELPFVLFLGLAGLDIIMMIISIATLCTLEQRERERRATVLLVWLIFWAVYMIYEAACVIYFVVQIVLQWGEFGTSIFDRTEMAFLVVPGIYWFIKLLINIAGYGAVFHYHRWLKGKGSFDNEGGDYRSVGARGRENPAYDRGGHGYHPGPKTYGESDGGDAHYHRHNEPRDLPARYPAGYPSYQHPKTGGRPHTHQNGRAGGRETRNPAYSNSGAGSSGGDAYKYFYEPKQGGRAGGGRSRGGEDDGGRRGRGNNNNNRHQTEFNGSDRVKDDFDFLDDY